MKFARRQSLHLAAGAAVLYVLCANMFDPGAWSQAAKTIKIVVPFPAGGGTDILARILGEQISRTQGLTILIENRPGAGAVIGTEAVSRAAPDGSTLLAAASAFVISPLLRKLNYDPLTSFEPICQLASTPAVLLVNSASPYRTLSELLDAARARPGSLTMGGIPGSPLHLGFEMLKRAANVDVTFVPYPGGAPAVSALLGNHVTSVFLPYSGLEEHLKAGKLRALASASLTRSEALPDVPTVAESGYKDFEIDFWNGLLAPAKTPKETVSELAGWFSTAMKVPEVNAKLVTHNHYPVGICGADFAALLRKQYVEYGRIITEANIKGD